MMQGFSSLMSNYRQIYISKLVAFQVFLKLHLFRFYFSVPANCYFLTSVTFIMKFGKTDLSQCSIDIY